VAAVRVRLFAVAREAADRAEDTFEVSTLGELLDAARVRYGERFSAVLATSRVWVNGEEAVDGEHTVLVGADEVAVLPPVSGG
jgi:molybdopterin synthase sulfur carrier subunit